MFVVWVLSEGRAKRVGQIAVVGAAAAALVAFWLVPLASDLGYTGSLNHANVTSFRSALVPSMLLPWCRWRLCGGTGSDASQSLRLCVVGSGAVKPVSFAVIGVGGIYSGRASSFYLVGIELLAAMGAVWLIEDNVSIVRAKRCREVLARCTVVPLGFLVALTPGVPLHSGAAKPVGVTPSFLPYWISWNYSGHQGNRVAPVPRNFLDQSEHAANTPQKQQEIFLIRVSS